jgi:hypothetical protein
LIQKSYEPISLALIPSNTSILLIPSVLGYEVSTDREDDPCEIHFSDYKKDSCGKELPGRIIIKYCDKEYASLKVDGWKLEYQFSSDA